MRKREHTGFVTRKVRLMSLPDVVKSETAKKKERETPRTNHK